MICFTDYITVNSTRDVEFIDITDDIARLVKSSGIRDGVVTLFTQHTTTALKINEKCGRLQEDMVEMMEKIAPRKGNYRHNIKTVDGRENGHSHLRSLFLNTSEQIPLKGGELLLGNWQRIFFIELDGPRGERRVLVSVVA
jgi:secondary thiamine-phosphate synthase enzyme